MTNAYPKKPRKSCRIRPMGFAFSLVLLVGVQACTDSARNLVESAAHTLAEGRPKEVVELLRPHVADNAENLDLQLLYGKALLASHQPSLAVWPLVRAMEHPVEGKDARLLLGKAQLTGGSAADAIKTATTLLDLNPEDTNALVLRAHALLAEKKEEEALVDLDLLADLVGVEDEHIALETLQLRLKTLLTLNLEVEAEELVEDFYARAQEDPQANSSLRARVCAGRAVFAAEKGDSEEAEQRFDDCLKNENPAALTLVQSAVEFFDDLDDTERGTQIWRDAVDAAPQNIGLLVQLTDRLLRTGQADEAEQLLLAAAENYSTAWSALIDLYLSTGDLESALHALDESLQRIPDPPALWNFTRADVLIVLGRFEEAEQAIEKLEIPVYRHIARGHLLLEQDQPAEALSELEAGIRLWPDNSDARFLAGHASDRLMDRERAMAHYREAARVDRPHKQATKALADHHMRLEQWGAAVQVMRRLTTVYPDDPESHELAVEIARKSGNQKLGRHHLNALSKLPGHGNRAIVLAMQIAREANGPASSIEVADSSGLDLAHARNHPAFAEMIKSYISLKRTKEALSLAQRAVAAAPPGDTRAKAYLAHILVEAGRRDEAQTIISELESHPLNDAMAAHTIAQTSLNLGSDLPSTLRLLANAAELASDDFEPVHETSRLEITHGLPSEATERLRHWLQDHPRDGEAASVLANLLLDRPEIARKPFEIESLARRTDLFHDVTLAREIRRRHAERNRDS